VRRALYACALVALSACRHSTAEPPAPTLAALSALRDALDRNELRGAVDPITLARAELLERLARMHDLQDDPDAVGITEDGWRRALANLDATYARAGLSREFNRARPLLGTGPCAQTERAPLPSALSPVASRRPTWPAFVDAEVRAPIARRAEGARAATFRCEGGSGAFLAVFLPREEGEGLVVARITAR
jgi:hypothetical protein